MLARNLSEDQLGLYLLGRRIVGLLFPVALVGGGIALPRYVSRADSPADRRGYVAGSLLIVAVVVAAMAIVAAVSGDRAASLIFGDNASASFLFIILIVLGGYSIKGIAFGYYRGIIDMYRANALQVATDALIPSILVFILTRGATNPGQVLAWMAVPYWLAGILVVATILRAGPPVRIGTHLRKLLTYGVPRLVDGVSNQGLLSLAPVFVQHFYGLRLAGFVILGQVLLRAVNSLFSPFGVVILPRVARMSGADREQLGERVVMLLHLIVHVGTFATVILFFGAGPVVSVWLGERYENAVPFMEVFSLAVAPYLAYVLLRSVLDGAEEKPMNTISLLAALATTLLAIVLAGVLGLPVITAAYAIVLGYLVLGVVTIVFTIRYFDLAYKVSTDIEVVGVSVIIAMGLYAVSEFHWGVDFHTEALIGLLGIVISIFVFITYLLFRRVDWVMEIVYRTMSTTSSDSS